MADAVTSLWIAVRIPVMGADVGENDCGVLPEQILGNRAQGRVFLWYYF